jgi:disulfide bond formation protein DsbB
MTSIANNPVSLEDLSPRSRRWIRIESTLYHVWILGICAVLVGAFTVQFGKGELPCPLCVIQRMCMILAAIGPAFVILQGRNQNRYGFSIIGSGFGISIMAAVGGMSVSARQVLLHVHPGDPGYGMPVFGMHLYTWALVVFVVIIIISGITVLFEPNLHVKAPKKLPWFSKVTLCLFGLIIIANAVAVLFETGPNWFLPANPDHYEGLNILDRGP